MDSFADELERFRRLLRIRHGLLMPELVLGEAAPIRAAIVRHLSPYGCTLLVADKNSLKAAEHLVKGALPESAQLIYQVFDAPAKPSMENVHHIVQIAREIKADAILAVGSGSIADMCKLAAHELALPLYMLATAPSMNGYTSITASIVHDGLKQSFHTFLAKAIFVDRQVIANAPERMKQAGAADALAEKSAMLDWKLSHLLLDTPYEEVLETSMVRADLMETLLLQGLKMTYAGVSNPASGAEHMLAHTVEMLEPALCAEMLHGEMIAYTLPLCAAYQRQLLDSERSPALAPAGKAEELGRLFGSSWSTIEPIFNVKQQTLDAMRPKVNERLQTHWQRWREELRKLLLSEAELKEIVKIPTNSSLTRACHKWLSYARFTRNRFTSLDLFFE